MLKRLLLLCPLAFSSCTLFGAPISTELRYTLANPVVDPAHNVFAIRNDGTAEGINSQHLIERFQVQDGRFVRTGYYSLQGVRIMRIDTTHRANELWLLLDGGPDAPPSTRRLERYRVESDRLVRTATVGRVPFTTLENITRFSAGPNDTVYMIGLFKAIIARCEIRNGGCADFSVQVRRSIGHRTLTSLEDIEVDMATGAVYVVNIRDGNDPHGYELLRYQPNLAPSHEAALTLEPTHSPWTNPAAYADFVVVRAEETSDRNGQASDFLLYHHAEGTETDPAGLYLSDRHRPRVRYIQVGAGRKLSSTCGYFIAATQPYSLRSSLERHLVGQDCAAFD